MREISFLRAVAGQAPRFSGRAVPRLPERARSLPPPGIDFPAILQMLGPHPQVSPASAAEPSFLLAPLFSLPSSFRPFPAARSLSLSAIGAARVFGLHGPPSASPPKTKGRVFLGCPSAVRCKDFRQIGCDRKISSQPSPYNTFQIQSQQMGQSL